MNTNIYWLDFNNAADQDPENGKIYISDERLRQYIETHIFEIVSHLYPLGRINGNVYEIGNLQGDKGKSLKIELKGEKAGQWYDFETKEGGDAFDLWGAYHRIDVKKDFHKVKTSICEWLGGAPEETHPPPKPTPALDTLGPQTARWDYLDEEGELIACVYRYDTKEGKEYRPWDVKARKTQAPKNRPLYNLPGIKDSQQVILVEGEKCADALIKLGICATTAMSGANATPDKTNWEPLKGKHVILWPDHDDAGAKYAQNVADELKNKDIASLAILNIPSDKPEKWDAADAVEEGFDVHGFIGDCPKTGRKRISYSCDDYLDDNTPMPEDLINPRVLTPGGMLVFGGAPKVGKSDFILSLLIHMASGEDFLGMKPPRPLKIYYLQAEVGYHYMRERIKGLKFDERMRRHFGKNLIITPQLRMILDEKGMEIIHEDIIHHFGEQGPDIIVVDPLRNLFDGGDPNATENDNSAMMFFLQKRLEALRNATNPDAGIILVHHTRKIQKTQLEDDPFQALSGASSLRGYYTSGMIMALPDESRTTRNLYFELRNGPRIRMKEVDKINGVWHEMDFVSSRLTNRTYGERLDAERRRKHDVILEIIYEEAHKGNAYTPSQFSKTFENKGGLGGQESIHNRLRVLASKGYIKFFRNVDDYNLPSISGSKYGYMCTEEMPMKLSAETEDSGKMRTVYPTHYRCRQSGAPLPVEDPKQWLYYDDDMPSK